MKLPLERHQKLSEEEAFSKMCFLGQEKILRHWSTLKAQQKEHLIEQIKEIDSHLLRRQQAAIKEKEASQNHILSPFNEYVSAGNLEHQLTACKRRQGGLSGACRWTRLTAANGGAQRVLSRHK